MACVALDPEATAVIAGAAESPPLDRHLEAAARRPCCSPATFGGGTTELQCGGLGEVDRSRACHVAW